MVVIQRLSFREFEQHNTPFLRAVDEKGGIFELGNAARPETPALAPLTMLGRHFLSQEQAVTLIASFACT